VDKFPFLPDDFDHRFFQAAPADQTCPHLRGGERVRLTHMTPEADLVFQLPRVEIPVKVCGAARSAETMAILDTVLIEPDLRECVLTWRASCALEGKLSSVQEVRVGAPSRGRLRADQVGKPFRARMAQPESARR
jgi:hypothetical protein